MAFSFFIVFLHCGCCSCSDQPLLALSLMSLNAKSLMFAMVATGEQRRSAVERLEETKAQYVKSERVLDSRQGLRSRRSEGATFEPPLLARSPSAYELVERLRASPPAALLARAPSLKLRRAPSPPMRARALSETQARRLLRPTR